MEDNYDLKKYKSVMNGWSFVRKIGHGSIGRVYEICKSCDSADSEAGQTDECVQREDPETELLTRDTQRAALKIISIPDGPEDMRTALSGGIREEDLPRYFDNVLQMFINEYLHMQRLRGCRHIVQYGNHMVIPHEDGIGGDILIRMELLTPLIDYALDNELSEDDVLKMGLDITDALMDCEAANILHRDIKPDNIFVSEDGEYKLGDFGVARIIEETEMNLSHKGTLAYMAPEVYRGEEYGMASDLYSLGLVMYKYLNNGRLPFMPRFPEELCYDDSDKALSRRIRREEPELPEHGSPALKAAVMKAISGNTADRYASAAEMHADLAHSDSDIGNESVIGLVAGNFVRKNKKACIAAAAVLLLAVIGGLVWAMIPKVIEDVKGIEPVAEIYIGESLAPEYTIEPDWFSDEPLTFESGNTEVITVDEEGKITAAGIGEADLVIRAGNKSDRHYYTERDTIRVVPKVTEISGIESELTMTEGDTHQLTPTLTPEKFSTEPVTFDTAESAVAVVNDEGIIAAVAPGQTKVTLSAGGCTREISLTVKAKPQPVYTAGSGVSGSKSSGSSSKKSSSKNSGKSSKSSSDGYIDDIDDEYFD